MVTRGRSGGSPASALPGAAGATAEGRAGRLPDDVEGREVGVWVVGPAGSTEKGRAPAWVDGAEGRAPVEGRAVVVGGVVGRTEGCAAPKGDGAEGRRVGEACGVTGCGAIGGKDGSGEMGGEMTTCGAMASNGLGAGPGELSPGEGTSMAN